MFTINSIICPLETADSEYSVCGNSVLHKAKVIDVFDRKENGNNIKIEVLEHENPTMVGKTFSVDDRFFEEAYIWIDAYKGTDKNMTCRGKTYAMDITYKYNNEPRLGKKGYHVCTDLKHVFNTYDYDFKNRFFRVKALVKATDYEYRNPNNTILVAKKVKFVEEITCAPSTITTKRSSMQ